MCAREGAAHERSVRDVRGLCVGRAWGASKAAGGACARGAAELEARAAVVSGAAAGAGETPARRGASAALEIPRLTTVGLSARSADCPLSASERLTDEPGPSLAHLWVGKGRDGPALAVLQVVLAAR